MPSQIVRNQAEKFAAIVINNRSRPASAASPLGCCGFGTCGGESFWGSKLLTVTRCWREISLGEDSLGENSQGEHSLGAARQQFRGQTVRLWETFHFLEYISILKIHIFNDQGGILSLIL